MARLVESPRRGELTVAVAEHEPDLAVGAGRVDIDLTSEPLGRDADGRPVFLADLWPTADEIRRVIGESIDPETLRGLLARYFERMRGIVEAHGGTITGENAPDRGARMVVRLPAARGEMQKSKAAA